MAALMKHRKYDADFCFFHSFEEPLSDVTSAWANADLQIMQTLETLIAPDRISVVHGEVDDALKSRLQIEKAALIQIGHHLYSSTKTILEKLSQRDVLQDGCIVLFNEFNCNRANESTGQRRALREFLESQERWTCSPWFSYGWHGQVYFFHDRQFVCESRLQTLHAA
jgi:hypothetical protein